MQSQEIRIVRIPSRSELDAMKTEDVRTVARAVGVQDYLHKNRRQLVAALEAAGQERQRRLSAEAPPVPVRIELGDVMDLERATYGEDVTLTSHQPSDIPDATLRQETTAEGETSQGAATRKRRGKYKTAKPSKLLAEGEVKRPARGAAARARREPKTEEQSPMPKPEKIRQGTFRIREKNLKTRLDKVACARAYGRLAAGEDVAAVAVSLGMATHAMLVDMARFGFAWRPKAAV